MSNDTARRFAWRNDRGETTLGVLMGVVIGTIVIGGFAAFLVTANRSSTTNTTFATQEAEAIQSLNRVGRDIQDTRSVLYANNAELVVEKNASQANEGTNDNTRKRSWVKFSIETCPTGKKYTGMCLIQRTWIDPNTGTDTNGDGVLDTLTAALYNHDTHTFAGKPAQVISDGIAAQTNGSAPTVFTYVNKRGLTLTAPPAIIGTATTAISRVDMKITLKTVKGNVELASSASVNTSPGGQAPILPPVCPTVNLTQANNKTYPTLTWNGVGGAYEYRIFRNSALVTTVQPVTPGSTAPIVFDDASAAGFSGTYTYSVVPFGDGGSPQSCPPVTWLAALDTPNLWGALSPAPAAGTTLNAADWTASGLSAPRMTLNYSPVPNATAYRVYVTPVSGGATVDRSSASGNGSTGGFIFTFTPNQVVIDGLPFGQQYRFTVRAENAVLASPVQSGASGLQSPLQVLTHPGAPVVNAFPADYKINQVTATGVGATSFDLFRGATAVDATTTAVPTGTIPTGNNYFDALAPGQTTSTLGPENPIDLTGLGTTWNYAGVSRNTGDRGRTSAGAAVTGNYASPMSAANTSFQFPTPPTTITAEGSDPGRDGTADAAYLGTNSVAWSGALSATSYRLLRYTSQQDAFYPTQINLTSPVTVDNATLNGTTCPFTGGCYSDTGRARGTEAVYDVVSLRACDPDMTNTSLQVTVSGATRCPSWNGSSLNAAPAPAYGATASSRAYQAPSALPQNVTGGVANADDCVDANGLRMVGPPATNPGTDNNGTYHCASRTATIAYSTVADENAPTTGKFCSYPGDPGDCETRTVGGAAGTYVGAVGTRTQTVTQTGWGAVDNYAIRACNLGGCSNATTKQIRAYPGPFEFTNIDSPDQRRYTNFQYWFNDAGTCWTNAGCNRDNPGEVLVRWSSSAGAAYYEWDRQMDSGGFTPTSTGAAGTGARSLTSAGWTAANPVYHSGYQAIDPTNRYLYRAVARTAAGDPLYRFATSPRGTQQTKFTANASAPSFLQDSPFCNTSVTNGWKYGYWFRKSSFVGNTNVSSRLTGFRAYWWVSLLSNGADNEVGYQAADRWLVNDKPDNGSNAWTPPGAWSDTTEYWENLPAYTTLDGTLQQTLIGGTNTSKVIPAVGQAAAGKMGVSHVRVEAYMTVAQAGNPDFSELSTWDGSNADPNGSRPDTQVNGSSEMRARALSISATSISNCAGSGTAGNRFSSSITNWTALGDHATVTRRAADALGSAAGNASARPGTASFRAWNNVS